MGTSVTRTGNAWSITAGTQRGGNLFHSFGRFNVDTGHSATFSGPGTVGNIIGRVTGGNASNIDGMLRSTISGANLYLINPSGLVFGPNASLDVSGSFHASTAHYLKLGADGRFDAVTPSSSVLTSAPPSAFGFLGSAISPVTVGGATLIVPNGKTLSLVGGGIALNGATLAAPAGRINLASAASAGELAPRAGGIDATPSTRFGDQSIADSSLHVNSRPGLASGTIAIRGGNLALVNSTVDSGNFGAIGPGGDINVTLSGDLSLDDAFIRNNALGAGNSGNLSIRARDIHLTGGSQINIITTAAGNGGELTIDASRSLVISGAPVGDYSGQLLNVSQGGSASGHAGPTRVTAPVVTLDAGIIQSYTEGTGDGGRIDVSAGRVSLLNGGQLFANTRGSGTAGTISVDASESVAIAGRNLQNNFPSGVFSNTPRPFSGPAGLVSISTPLLIMNDGLIQSASSGTGNAGDIVMRLGRLEMTNGAQISNSTAGPGHAGRMSIAVSGPVTLSGRHDGTGLTTGLFSQTQSSGNAGSISVTAGELHVTEGANINAADFGSASGNGGTITLRAGKMALTNGGGIVASVSGSGNAGDISITATESLHIAGFSSGGDPSGIFSSSRAGASGNAGTVSISAPVLTMNDGRITSQGAGIGDAGTITLDVGRLELVNGARIGIETEQIGRGGMMTINASDSITISGRSPDGTYSGLFSFSIGSGDAGSIFITTPSLSLTQASIQSLSEVAGQAGNITVRAGNVTLVNGSQISAAAFGTARGGFVNVQASGTIRVSGTDSDGFNSVISSETGGSGTGGPVTIAAADLVLDNGFVQSSAGALGRAGDITMRAARIRVLNGGRIDAGTSSAFRGGSVDVAATESILISGRAADGTPGGVLSATGGSGAGGPVTVSAPTIVVSDGAVISSESTNTGDAGSIAVSAGKSLQLLNGGSIVTQAARGDGGNITITASDLVHLRDSSITTSVGAADGNGGNITIDPVFVVLNNGRILANAVGGDGGNINIVSQFFIANTGSLVQASSEFGLQGEITVTAPNVDVSAGLAALPSGFFDASLLLRESCAARAGRSASSSFTGVGRGGLPATPGGMAFGSYYAAADAAAIANAGFTLASARMPACR